MLLSAPPRLALMLYELTPPDGDTPEKKIEKLCNKSTELLDMLILDFALHV